jgi:putative pyoverdin transport system ATP-binding/permease protein
VPSYLQLLRFLNGEAAGPKLRIIVLSLVSGFARGALLATFNTAAARGAQGLDLLLVASFFAALALYLATAYDSARQTELMVAAMAQRLRLRLCEKLLFARMRFLEGRNLGEVYTQLGRGVNRMAEAAMALLLALQSAVIVVFAFAYLAWLSLPGFCAASVALVAGIGIYYWQERRTLALVEEARRYESKFYDAIGDVVWGYKELKLRRGRHSDLWAHLTDMTTRYRDFDAEVQRRSTVSALTTQSFNFALVAVLVFALPAVFPGGTAAVFQFLATILYIISPVEALVSAFPNISRARIWLQNLQGLEAELDSGLEENRAPAVAAARFGALALRDVHYRFEGDSPDQRFDLGPVDLELRRGEILFMVGGNGAGKTTLLKLITGLYVPLSGQILVDGMPLQPADRQAYREMFAAVFSDFHLFKRLYGTAGLGAPALDPLLAELQIAHKTRLENGAFTTLELSSGQRKRLAYAVERIADRQIYVFDEFASDQDPNFRRYFYRELLPGLKRQGKTVIAVTHDERWFDVADRVIKMDYGRIVELSTGAAFAAAMASPAS